MNPGGNLIIMNLQIANKISATRAEGPGLRFAFWVQGCTLHCPGCCNPEMFTGQGGYSVSPEEFAEEIINTPNIEGVSMLGGEPFQQPLALGKLSRLLQKANLSIMVYSGYTHDELLASKEPGLQDFRSRIDLLVDGRFEKDIPEERRRWIGSANQNLIFLTKRYNATNPMFHTGNTVEIRYKDGVLSVVGWPAGARKVIE